MPLEIINLEPEPKMGGGDHPTSEMPLCRSSSVDWPADNPEITACYPQLRQSSKEKMKYPSDLLPRCLPNDDWPSDDELGPLHLRSESSSEIMTPSDENFSHIRGGESEATSLGFSQEEPIDLTNDQDLVDMAVVGLTDKLDRIGQRFHTNPGDWMTDAQFADWLLLSPRENPNSEVAEAVVEGIVYRPSMSLQLRDGSYLRIESICRRRGQYFLYGRHLMESTDRRVEGYTPKTAGELVWMTKFTGPFSLDEVKEFRRISFTNSRTNWIGHVGLVCRLKMTVGEGTWTPTEGSRHREPLNAERHSIEYLTFEEADDGHRWSSTELRDSWRGPNETVPFGECELPTTMAAPPIFDHEGNAPPTVDLTGIQQRTYTVGDAYCGAGGTSCGARQAGLSIRWASDINNHAVNTYQRNFDGTIIYHADFFDLMAIPQSELRVDICHCSPPCQPFSPAHTVANQVNDERNSACVFTARNLLQRARPRILTMEETYGLRTQHKDTFTRIILDFIEEGYSVRWAVLQCSDYGVPQRRRRLIIIAAGPGETLPELPSPTHGMVGSGLLPVVTIHDVIHDLPPDAADHDVAKCIEDWEKSGDRSPYSAHQPAGTITCNGGEFNYHPDGKRRFTCREVACLQTFPRDFEFSRIGVRRQIGNAVPPAFATAVFREIYKSLRETDEKEMRETRRRGVRTGNM